MYSYYDMPLTKAFFTSSQQPVLNDVLGELLDFLNERADTKAYLDIQKTASDIIIKAKESSQTSENETTLTQLQFLIDSINLLLKACEQAIVFEKIASDGAKPLSDRVKAYKNLCVGFSKDFTRKYDWYKPNSGGLKDDKVADLKSFSTARLNEEKAKEPADIKDFLKVAVFSSEDVVEKILDLFQFKYRYYRTLFIEQYRACEDGDDCRTWRMGIKEVFSASSVSLQKYPAYRDENAVAYMSLIDMVIKSKKEEIIFMLDIMLNVFQDYFAYCERNPKEESSRSDLLKNIEAMLVLFERQRPAAEYQQLRALKEKIKRSNALKDISKMHRWKEDVEGYVQFMDVTALNKEYDSAKDEDDKQSLITFIIKSMYLKRFIENTEKFNELNSALKLAIFKEVLQQLKQESFLTVIPSQLISIGKMFLRLYYCKNQDKDVKREIENILQYLLKNVSVDASTLEYFRFAVDKNLLDTPRCNELFRHCVTNNNVEEANYYLWHYQKLMGIPSSTILKELLDNAKKEKDPKKIAIILQLAMHNKALDVVQNMLGDSKLAIEPELALQAHEKLAEDYFNRSLEEKTALAGSVLSTVTGYDEKRYGERLKSINAHLAYANFNRSRHLFNIAIRNLPPITPYRYYYRAIQACEVAMGYGFRSELLKQRDLLDEKLIALKLSDTAIQKECKKLIVQRAVEGRVWAIKKRYEDNRAVISITSKGNKTAFWGCLLAVVGDPTDKIVKEARSKAESYSDCKELYNQFIKREKTSAEIEDPLRSLLKEVNQYSEKSKEKYLERLERAMHDEGIKHKDITDSIIDQRKELFEKAFEGNVEAINTLIERYSIMLDAELNEKERSRLEKEKLFWRVVQAVREPSGYIKAFFQEADFKKSRPDSESVELGDFRKKCQDLLTHYYEQWVMCQDDDLLLRRFEKPKTIDVAEIPQGLISTCRLDSASLFKDYFDKLILRMIQEYLYLSPTAASARYARSKAAAIKYFSPKDPVSKKDAKDEKESLVKRSPQREVAVAAAGPAPVGSSPAVGGTSLFGFYGQQPERTVRVDRVEQPVQPAAGKNQPAATPSKKDTSRRP